MSISVKLGRNLNDVRAENLNHKDDVYIYLGDHCIVWNVKSGQKLYLNGNGNQISLLPHISSGSFATQKINEFIDKCRGENEKSQNKETLEELKERVVARLRALAEIAQTKALSSTSELDNNLYLCKQRTYNHAAKVILDEA